jgi:hypothetical protein
LFCLNFDVPDSTAGLHFYFDSTRPPVWGDFIAIDENPNNYVYNAGFGSGSTADPDNGTVLNEILRPDTGLGGNGTTGPAVPEPLTLVSGLLAVGIVRLYVRKRTKASA